MRHKRLNRRGWLFLAYLLLSTATYAQNDVMMQAFYWDVPVDATNKNGTWWDNLRTKAVAMKNAGFTGIWVPSPAKGNWGIEDMGYGIFDHYDLGNYFQKDTYETRFGSRTELEDMLEEMHDQGIEVYADIVLNHIYTNDDQSEVNPAVKQYVFDEAFRGGNQYQAYPTNEITWVIPNASPGDYYIQIKGYLLNWGASHTERGYDVYIDWNGTAAHGSQWWESEPNNGSGNFNTFPGSGRVASGHMNTSGDIDEYKITLSSTHDIVIKLTARREDTSSGWNWAWAAQENGYYPVAVWYGASNLANSTLQARTNTGISYVTHTGTGEANFTWNYTHFHPVDNSDWLGFPGSDEIITNTKFFGNDLNTFDNTVQTRLKNWGYWLADEIGFDGFRLDFVRGFQESFAADWINNLPLKGGNQRFIVGEYWGADYRIKNWVNTLAGYGADADGFDFPLKSTLTNMVNGNQSSFNMTWLDHAGLVRNNSGNGLPGTSVVTFLDNHDTGKEHDKWATKDFRMAYAYILTHEGRPTVFYPHYYGVTQHDAHGYPGTVTAPSGLRDDIDQLMFVRKNYLGGVIAVLSQIGSPYPDADKQHVYVARRQGNGTRDGAIVVINNHDTNAMGLWVDTDASGFSNWANVTLVNAFDDTQTAVVQNDGRVSVSAPSRGYSVWVKESDYLEYTAPNKTAVATSDGDVRQAEKASTFALLPNYPNPFNPTTVLGYTLPFDGKVTVKVYNALGRLVSTVYDGHQSAGNHRHTFDGSGLSNGVYLYSIEWNGQRIGGKMTLMK